MARAVGGRGAGKHGMCVGQDSDHVRYVPFNPTCTQLGIEGLDDD